MKENDEFALKNEEYEDDARAVKESELLPIFEAMDFSGDIQPLEDFEIPEPTVVDLQSKKKSDSKSADKNGNLKLKKIPGFSGSHKLKKLAIVLPIVLVLIGLTAFGVNYFISSEKNTAPVRTIYSSDRLTYLNLDNGKTYEIIDAQNIKISNDGMKVFYSKNTTSRTGKFDIKYVNVGKTSSLKREGGNICSGVDEGWSANGDGSFVCYSITKSGLKQFYIYSAETGKSEALATDIDEVFLPEKGDAIYFTRRNGSIYSLHRMRYGEDSQNVASEIDYVKYCSSDDGFEIIYTVSSGNKDSVDVFSVKNFDVPVQICDGAGEVYLNDYVYGGNLYYFKKKTANVNWEDFISDPYRESDAGLQRPSESDYMIEYGFIFKRYILDESAYKAANAKYQAKLRRDEVRAELDRIDFGLAVEDEYTCYVYNNYANKMLASGVSLKNIVSFSVNDAPSIIFRKSVINAEKNLTMDELVSIASKSDATAASDYVRENVEKAFKLSDDCIYAWYDGSKVAQYTINNYNPQSTQFYPASHHSIYALSDGKLYLNTISQSEFKSSKAITSNVAECEVNGDFIYYKKSVTDDILSLYRYSPDTGEQFICDNVYSYALIDNDSVIAFSQQEENMNIATVGIYNDGQYSTVDTDVALGHFVYNNSAFAYIKNVGKSDVANAGDMYIYVIGSGAVNYNGDVTDIIYLKEDLSYQKIEKH